MYWIMHWGLYWGPPISGKLPCMFRVQGLGLRDVGFGDSGLQLPEIEAGGH